MLWFFFSDVEIPFIEKKKAFKRKTELFLVSTHDFEILDHLNEN